MYKMYNTQFDDESDDDRNSLNSSFWSDGENKGAEEEEEVEVERVISQEDSKPAGGADEETSKLKNKEERGKSDEDDDDDDDEEKDDDDEKEEDYDDKEEEEEDDDEEEDEEEEGEVDDCGEEEDDVDAEEKDDDDDDDKDDDDDDKDDRSSCDSPVPSLMTSGYGTYRAEEQEGGDFRDDHTITEFDQESHGDLSEMRDDEDNDHSLCSFGGFDIEPAELDFSETRPLSLFDGDGGLHEEANITDTTTEEKETADGEETEKDLCAAWNIEVTNTTFEEEQHVAAEVKRELVLDGKCLEGGSFNVEEVKQNEREEEVQDLKEENKMKEDDSGESQDSDESSSNRDIKFIDSKVTLSQMTYDEMCEDWEGNVRVTQGK